MLVVVGILVTVAVIIAIEVPPLLRKKLKKDLWVFSIFTLIGTLLSVFHALNIRIPNPLDGLAFIYRPISDIINKLFN